MILIFTFLLAYSSQFLDPFHLDKEDILIEETSASQDDDEQNFMDLSASKGIKTDKMMLWPRYTNTESYSALGADFLYSFSFDSAYENIPSLIYLSLTAGSNAYLDSKFLFDSFWYSNVNNLTFYFSSNIMQSQFYESGMDEPSYLGSYDAQNFDFNFKYRRNFMNIYFGISYFIKNLNSDVHKDYENHKNAFLSGLSISVDNKKCTNILYKEAKFLYGVSYNSFLKILGSEQNLSSIELDLEKTFLISKNDFLLISFFYKSYLSETVPYLALYTPYELLRPYSTFKYLGKEYMSTEADFRLLFFRNTYLSINGAGFQSRNSLDEFLLDDFMYSYGLGLLFPITKNLYARFDYSTNKEEKNFYFSISN